MPPSLPDLSSLTASGPLAARILAGGAGLLLLFAGSRIYRLAVLLPGMLLGLAGALLLGAQLALPSGPAGALALGGAVAGGVLAFFLERAAVRLAGMAAGVGAVHALLPLAALGPTPWWAWPVGAVLGLLLGPLLWRVALVPLTAWIGALALLQAVDMGAPPVAVAGLAVVGAAVQWAGGRRGGADAQKPMRRAG